MNHQQLIIKPDVIVSWPRNNEYPLWRYFISENRFRFNKVFIVFTETYHGDDYRYFIRSVMPSGSFTIIDSTLPQGIEDWRDVAIQEALRISKNDWLWFTEEDFFPKNEQFWVDVNRELLNNNAQAIGVRQGTRLHPCSLFITRELINKTHRDFGVVPNKLDHFGRIEEDLNSLQIPIAIIDPSMWKHYNGLSHNFRLVSDMKEPVYEPQEFYDYLKRCLQIPGEIDVRFKLIAERALERSGNNKSA